MMNKMKFFKLAGIALTVILMGTTLSTQGQTESNKFKLADKDKLSVFYENGYQNVYNYIPTEIANKHKEVIEKVDSLLSKEAGGITSKDNEFSLNYYENLIRVAIKPYVIKDKELNSNIDNLLKDISKYTKKENVENDKLKKIPTIVGEVKNEDVVIPTLNASSYSATKAVSYAKSWTTNGQITRNSAYDYYDGMSDCTNFISQCLHDSNAGGIPYIRNDSLGYDYDDPDNWYYANSFNNPPSHTWGAVENLYDHLANYGTNVRKLSYFSECKLGDIIQWDLDGDSSVLEHSTIITKIENGKIYLTYHSSDKEDEPIDTFLNAGYTGYAWAVNH